MDYQHLLELFGYLLNWFFMTQMTTVYRYMNVYPSFYSYRIYINSYSFLCKSIDRSYYCIN